MRIIEAHVQKYNTNIVSNIEKVSCMTFLPEQFLETGHPLNPEQAYP